MGVEYRRADEVAHIAWELIQDFHLHLENVRIEYVWRDKASARGDKVVLGKARRVSGLNAFLSRMDQENDEWQDYFVVEIAADTWAGMSAAQRKALVDHELAHFGINEKGQLVLVHHDIEEFQAVLQRHGAYKPDLAQFIEIGKGVQRLALVPDAGPEGVVESDDGEAPPPFTYRTHTNA